MKRFFLLPVLLACGLYLPLVSAPQAVPISNADFESGAGLLPGCPILQPGAFHTIGGWDFSVSFAESLPAYSWPRGGILATSANSLGGSQAGHFQFFGPEVSSGIVRQSLGATLMPNSTYLLQADIGRMTMFDQLPASFGLRIWAGDTLLAEGNQNTLSMDTLMVGVGAGRYGLAFTSGTVVSGSPLTVELYASNSNAHPGAILFDNFQLGFTTLQPEMVVPEPATAALLAGFGALLVAWWRRRRNA